ncbi:MAG: biosynthetic-type acetolactate synthase large subunit [Verrucomicrobiales bacterium]|nr:biosynthetic-type acetolactate synthase large subunit [Verrucomicrobiales bacterium]
MKNNQSTAAAKQTSSTLSGADILVRALEREGVDTVFAYPGGNSMLFHQALTRSKPIRTILPRHEQGGAFMAGGYARASGKVGVCMATSGPGATNLITGVADAFMDSIPLIAITGQVTRSMIGKTGFQETDVYGMTVPIVKHSYLVMDVNDIPRVVKEAFKIATTGRPGPVWIDVPKDVQAARTRPVWPADVDLPGLVGHAKAGDDALLELLALVEKSARPLLHAGGGVISANAAGELKKFAEATHIPVSTTLMGVGAFPETHPLACKWLGMHGPAYANRAADDCDLLIAVGVRFSDRVTSKVSEFAKRATIVHIETDAAELNKNKVVQLPILSDVKYALRRLNELIRKGGRQRKDFPAWHKKIAAWKRAYPLRYRARPDVIMPQQVVAELSKLTRGDAIISTGVGQHQMWAAQFYDYVRPRTYLSSLGLGAMGFGYPAALGAQVARPGAQVVDIDGDGSFMMNVQELATAAIEKIPAKVIIINNQYLGMVMQWEDRFFASNRGHTYLGDHADRGKMYPDYVTICAGFGVKAEQVSKPADLVPALKRMLAAREPYVLDVLVPETEHVLPMIPAGTSVRETILEPMAGGAARLTGDIPG